MPNVVDPFVPMTRHTIERRQQRRLLRRSYRDDISLSRHPQITSHNHRHHRPADRPVSRNHEQVSARPRRPYSAPPPQKQWLAAHPWLRRLLQLLQIPAILLGSMAAGILLQSPTAGQAIFGIYAIIALIFRINSRMTFLLAFFLLCLLVGMLIFRTNNAMSANLAIYTFILLLVGVISLLREAKERYA